MLVALTTKSVQDLIRRILETNPEKRLTVEMIRQHPWFTSMRAVVPRALAERENAVIKDMILGQLGTLGFEETEVLDAVQKNAHNNTTASYYLLYSKLVRIMKERGGSKVGVNGGMTPRTGGGGATVPVVPQHKRLDEVSAQPRSSPTQTSQPAAKKVGSVDAMAGVNGAAQPVSSPSNEPSSKETSSARRHSTQPSPSPHYNKENVARAATPSGASPRHPQAQYAQSGASTSAAAPSPSSQPRRPSSVRSGRNLVLLSNGGNHQPLVSAVPPSAVGVIPVPPRRPSGSIIMKPPGATTSHMAAAGGSRVSVSNGMVALTPIAHHSHRTAAGSGAPTHVHSRRHTLEVSHHSSPRSSVGTGAHPPTMSNMGTTSSAGSSGDSSTIVARRRISLHPAAATAVGSPSVPTTCHLHQPAASASTVPHAPPVSAASLKEDDSRQPQSSGIRIHAHHPQPPSGTRHGSHFAAIL